MRVLAIYSIKGGVGKTASAVNLAYAASRDQARTLLWDLDPQGASTFYFRVKPKVKGGIKSLLRRKRAADRLVKATDYAYLDLLPADLSYRYADLIVHGMQKPLKKIKKVIKPLRDDYDVLLLDCPPSVSLWSENVLQVVEAVIVPVIPTTLSLRTLEQLRALCDAQEYRHVKILPFFSMVDRRKNLHRTVLEELPRQFPGILQTQIPYASVVEQMGLHRAPLETYAAHSLVAEHYRALWQEVRAELRLGR
ncbi:MAG: ParA family protein [Deltaproteobacteria bacterium]|jgi:cellulose biosynthesis protein BcsQ|nr:ParA family protein [Deltaproteobacteria bacterium]MBW2530127.1 ParA family protein [Deltaproteobacteria bacterium]